MPIIQQVSFVAPNRPGQLARICDTLAQKKINITGLHTSGTDKCVRLITNSPARARTILQKAGWRARLEPAVMVNAPDRPGQLARIARKLAQRKININYAYATVPPGAKRASIVLGVGNPGRALRLLG